MLMMLQPVARYLRSWWDQLSSFGPAFGYFPNASKTWLVIKEQFQSHAISAFQDTAVNVTSDGRPHLGAPIGSAKYCDNLLPTRSMDGFLRSKHYLLWLFPNLMQLMQLFVMA